MLYTTSCKHSLVLLRMDEIIVRNMLSWLKLLIKLLLLHVVGCLYYYMILLIYLLTYLLTPWCRVLLEKITGLQLVKKFPTFHGTRKFITALTSVRHLSLPWASPIQSIYPHPTSWRSILILSTHLRLGLPSGLLPSGFLRKTLYTSLSSPISLYDNILLYDTDGNCSTNYKDKSLPTVKYCTIS